MSYMRTFAMFLLFFGFAIALSGCGAVEHVDQNTVWYTSQPGTILLMLGAGLALTAVGALFLFLDYSRGAGRRKRKHRESAGSGSVASSVRGWGLLLCGVLFLLGGVPGVLLSKVTITPELVIINDSPFWFAPNRATIRFADIESIATEIEEKWGRRGKRSEEYIVFQLKNGSTERVKVGALVRAAQDRIAQGAQAFRNGPDRGAVASTGGKGVAAPQAGRASTQAPQTGRDQAGAPAESRGGIATSTVFATPNMPPAVPAAQRVHIGSLRPGMRLEAFWGTNWLPVDVLDIQPDGRVMVHWDGYADAFNEALSTDRLRLPAGSSPRPGPEPEAPRIADRKVTAQTPIQVGMKLEANWGNNWLPVEVLGVQPDGQVRIHWDGYSNAFDEVVSRSRLRLPASR